MDVSQLVEEMRAGIQAEKLAVQKALGSLSGVGKVRFGSGRRLHADPGAQVYRLTCDIDFVIPDGTSVQLKAPGVVSSGETLRHDPHGERLECVLREDLGEDLGPGTLEFDATFLLNLLEERLVAIAAGPEAGGGFAIPAEPYYRDHGMAFLEGRGAPEAPVPASFPGLTSSQQDAVRLVLGQRVGYLWGPPGTGKTQTVSHLVHALLERGEKVLLAAHTNIATDNALLRVLQTRRLPRDSVVRVGHHADSLAGFDIGLDSAVGRWLERSHGDLLDELETICRVVQELHPRPGRSLDSRRQPLVRRFRTAAGIVDAHGCGAEADLPSRIAAADKQVDAVERSVLSGASLVATTLTRCYSSRLFREFRTDATVIDEASTASLATSFVVACASRRRTIAVGDFRQLPTIVQATHPGALRWLGRHVFETSGTDRVHEDHPLRAMLHEQWRMHPGISAIVSRTFYGGRLTDAPEVQARARPGPAVALLDSTPIGPRTQTTSSGSKVNACHAGLIAEVLALEGIDDRSVAVITPYRAQVQAIRDAVRARRPELLATDQLEVFTVHRFQGRDKDVVIFDLAEGPGTGCRFLDDLKMPHAPNLINVAMSRAKERLVVLGAFQHIGTSLGNRSIVMQVLAAARTGGALQLEARHPGDTEKLRAFLRRHRED